MANNLYNTTNQISVAPDGSYSTANNINISPSEAYRLWTTLSDYNQQGIDVLPIVSQEQQKIDADQDDPNCQCGHPFSVHEDRCVSCRCRKFKD